MREIKERTSDEQLIQSVVPSGQDGANQSQTTLVSPISPKLDSVHDLQFQHRTMD